MPCAVARASAQSDTRTYELRVNPQDDVPSVTAHLKQRKLVIADVSVSMTDVIDDVSRTIRAVAAALRPTDELCVVTFSNESRNVTGGFVPAREFQMNNLVVEGGTSLLPGLATAREILQEDPDRESYTSVILITDGHVQDRDAVEMSIDGGQALPPVHTIGIGEYDGSLCAFVSARTGGVVTSPLEHATLNETIHMNLSKILERCDKEVVADRVSVTVMVDPAAYEDGVRAVKPNYETGEETDGDVFDGMILDMDHQMRMFTGESYSEFFILKVPEAAAARATLATVKVALHFLDETTFTFPDETVLGTAGGAPEEALQRDFALHKFKRRYAQSAADMEDRAERLLQLYGDHIQSDDRELLRSSARKESRIDGMAHNNFFTPHYVLSSLTPQEVRTSGVIGSAPAIPRHSGYTPTSPRDSGS